MAKKKARTRRKPAPKKRPAPKKKQAPRSLFPTKVAVLTRIVIPKNGTAPKPAKLIGFRKTPIVWLIHNKDTDAHTISIDPASFEVGGVANNPLTETTHIISGSIPGGHWDVLVGHMRPDADVLLSYHYEIELRNMADATSTRIDPDLDVVDPQP